MTTDSAPPVRGSPGAWWRAIRPAHHVKNLLVAVPWLAHHGPFTAVLAWWVLFAFLALSLVAASSYLANDVLDREADRLHPLRMRRPLAAGTVGAAPALVAAVFLLLSGFAVATALLPEAFLVPLLLYVVGSLSYSLWWKRVVVLDVILLSALYTVRIVGGGMATGIRPSPWLLALSGFLFLSLAILKRYAELRRLDLPPTGPVPGRGYVGSDLDVLRAAGLAAGCLSVLVLALYVNGEQATLLYASPAWLWAATPALLWWILRLWILAHRGALLDDPVVFALRDPASWVAAIWILLAGIAAARL